MFKKNWLKLRLEQAKSSFKRQTKFKLSSEVQTKTGTSAPVSCDSSTWTLLKRYQSSMTFFNYTILILHALKLNFQKNVYILFKDSPTEISWE